MSYDEVRAIPLRAFWFMQSQVTRLMAERDLRALSIAEAAALITSDHAEHSGSVRTKLVKELSIDIDRSEQITEQLDRVGLEQLRRIM